MGVDSPRDDNRPPDGREPVEEKYDRTVISSLRLPFWDRVSVQPSEQRPSSEQRLLEQRLFSGQRLSEQQLFSEQQQLFSVQQRPWEQQPFSVQPWERLLEQQLFSVQPWVQPWEQQQPF